LRVSRELDAEVSTNHQVPHPEAPAEETSRVFSGAHKARILAECGSLDKADMVDLVPTSVEQLETLVHHGMGSIQREPDLAGEFFAKTRNGPRT
jgi:hypothetical protein